MMSPTFRFDAAVVLERKRSPGFAYGRILPVKIGEKPIPNWLCATDGAAMKRAAMSPPKTFKKALREVADALFFDTVASAMTGR